MSRVVVFALYFSAIFLQAGAYGLTFMLPRLFDSFGANEKVVGAMLALTAISTIVTVYFSGHLSDLFGRLRTLGGACLAIALSLYLYAIIDTVGIGLISASLLLGFGWGLTYSLGPIVLTRLVVANERTRFFTLLSLFVMAGFGLAPVLAAALEGAGYSVRDAFTLTAIACLVSTALFFGLNGAVKTHAVTPIAEVPSRITLAALRGVARSSALLPVAMVCLGASVFAGMANFQTVFADARGLDYAQFFLTYTTTVVLGRMILARYKGGENTYRTIAVLQYIMGASVVLFIFSGASLPAYLLVAFLFGVGYGMSYPLLVSMAAQDADDGLGAQTLQLFALTYFIGIFGFPLIAGWMIVEVGTTALLILTAMLAIIEATLALRRAQRKNRPHQSGADGSVA